MSLGAANAAAYAVHDADMYKTALFAEHEREREDSKSAWHKPASLLLAVALHSIIFLQFGSMFKPDIVPPHLDPIMDITLLPIATASEIPKQNPPVTVKKQLISPMEPAPPVHRSEQQAQKQAVKKNPAKKHHTPKPLKHIQATASIVQSAPAKPQIKPLIQSLPATLPEVKQQQTSDTTIVVDHHRQKLLSQQYLAAIMARVKAHKTYPYSARRRHTEGNITVSFLLDEVGRISDIQIHGKSSVLCKASMRAIEASQPFPSPPHKLNPPVRSRFIMQYALK